MDTSEKLFAGPCDFMLGVAVPDQLPEPNLPEVAFAGRSNVGKSSLLNALTGRTKLAKTSHTPGRTQQLNFFNIGGALYLVDMPGYGYAKVSRDEQKKWQGLIRAYLKNRENLRCVFLLIDARHGIKDSDREIMTMLDIAGVAYRIILTKKDKVKTQELDKILEESKTELKKHPAAFPEILATSSFEKEGLEELRQAVVSYT